MFAAIEPNMTRDGAENVTKNVCVELENLKINFAFSERNREIANKLGRAVLSESELYQNCDVAVAIGGDGSIIRAAKRAAEYQIPVLGINAGNVAFMAGLEADELPLLSALINGDYAVDNRMMLHVEIVQNEHIIYSANCLNDAVFARGSEIYLTEILVECDGLPVNKYRCDGIVLATPTGSTAYSFAAGGPVVEPTLESMILSPISSYAKSSRCIIFSAESQIKVYPANALRPLFLSADGTKSVQIPADAYVCVAKCDHDASFIRIKNDRFWHILDNKIEK